MTPEDRRLIRRFYDTAERHGLTLGAMRLLVLIADGDGPTTGELADLLRQSDGALSRMRRKIPAEWVQEEPNGGRSFRLYLTEPGRAFLAAIGKEATTPDEDDL